MSSSNHTKATGASGNRQNHIAYGSIRMEPVFMVMGQSAATAALAIDGKTSVQGVDYGKLRERLLKDRQVLDLE